MTDTVITALAPVADWYLNQIATHGWFKVLAATALVLLATWCGFGIACHWYATRSPEFTEAQRIAQANARVGFTDQEIADRAFVQHVEAELKDYGAIIADLYVPAGTDEQNGGQP